MVEKERKKKRLKRLFQIVLSHKPFMMAASRWIVDSSVIGMRTNDPRWRPGSRLQEKPREEAISKEKEEMPLKREMLLEEVRISTFSRNISRQRSMGRRKLRKREREIKIEWFIPILSLGVVAR